MGIVKLAKIVERKKDGKTVYCVVGHKKQMPAHKDVKEKKYKG